MSKKKYVGMDVHKSTIVIVVLNESGQVEMKTLIPTKTESIREFFKTLSGTVKAVLEEGTHSAWVYHLIKPLVSEVIVSNPRHNKLIEVGNKSDFQDAEKLAYLLRLGGIKSVYKGDQGQLEIKELVRAYENLVSDANRAKNRLKALYRGRGIECKGRALYRSKERAVWLEKLGEPGARFRAQSLYAELETIQELRQAAKKRMIEQARRHPDYRMLKAVPGFGPVRVAQLLAVVGTPHRFRTKRQFWPYCGLAVTTRTSADYQEINGNLVKRQKNFGTRGLNWNHNRRLKHVFKSAATTAMQQEPFKLYYERQVDQGQRPELVRLSLARKLAAITLKIWKSRAEFDPAKVTDQIAA